MGQRGRQASTSGSHSRRVAEETLAVYGDPVDYRSMGTRIPLSAGWWSTGRTPTRPGSSIHELLPLHEEAGNRVLAVLGIQKRKTRRSNTVFCPRVSASCDFVKTVAFGDELGGPPLGCQDRTQFNRLPILFHLR